MSDWAAQQEPVELAKLLETDPSIIRAASVAFEGWCEQSIPRSEDDISNLIVSQISKMKIGLLAKRKDHTYAGKGKPDIWVFPEHETPSTIILIEVLDKKARDSEWKEHISRNYESISGYVVFTDGVEVIVYFNGVLYATLDLRRERCRHLFVSFLQHARAEVSSRPSRRYISVSDIEKEYAKSISLELRDDINIRLLVSYLISVAVLEHNGYLSTRYVDTLACSDRPDYELQNLLKQRQQLPSLELLRQRCREISITLENRVRVCMACLVHDSCIVNFRGADSYLLSRLYEYSFNKEERKQFGIFTTPKSVCLDVVKKAYSDLTCNDSLPDSIRVTVADISCGSGNFLEAFIHHIYERVEYGTDDHGIERRARYAFTIIGRDVNIEAVCFAEVACTLAVFKRSLSIMTKNHPVSLVIKFNCGDSSNSADVAECVSDSDYVLWLGNPPFVKQANMANAVVHIKSWKSNLGTIFLENMLSIDAKRIVVGIVFQVALIGPQCERIQSMLESKHLKINHFRYFGKSRMFTGLAPQKWCTMVISGQSSARTFKHIPPLDLSKTVESVDTEIRSLLISSVEQPLSDALQMNDFRTFMMISSFDRELAEIICNIPTQDIICEEGIKPANEFFDGKHCFQVPTSLFSSGKISDYEKTFLFPYWNESRGDDFFLNQPSGWLIDIPKTEFLNEDDFSLRAPNLYKHLVFFKRKLQISYDRKNNPDLFWTLARNRSGRIYTRDKVVMPQLLNFSYPVLGYIDEIGFGVPNNMNIISGHVGYRKDWYIALAGWLNSGVIAFYLNGMNGSKPRGSGGELKPQYLKRVPILSCILFASCEANEALVKQLIATVRCSQGKLLTQYTAIQNTIDRICTELLELEIMRQNKSKAISVIAKEDWLESASTTPHD